MAWLLADAAQSCLAGHERNLVFAELGSGEHCCAIERILTAVMLSRMVVPTAILSTLSGWLYGYASSPEEPQLRRLLAAIRLQQLEAVSAHVQGPDSGDGQVLLCTNPPPSEVGGADLISVARVGVTAGSNA